MGYNVIGWDRVAGNGISHLQSLPSRRERERVMPGMQKRRRKKKKQRRKKRRRKKRRRRRRKRRKRRCVALRGGAVATGSSPCVLPE